VTAPQLDGKYADYTGEVFVKGDIKTQVPDAKITIEDGKVVSVDRGKITVEAPKEEPDVETPPKKQKETPPKEPEPEAPVAPPAEKPTFLKDPVGWVKEKLSGSGAPGAPPVTDGGRDEVDAPARGTTTPATTVSAFKKLWNEWVWN
jgi:outer membrane biosynthesis protein TonB